ncbi:metallophosphoesterase family protein [Paenibacillus sp. OV219]|uniref:metallophosphoesterase family protein n=1 Tax=Paenibacillus sp. OV219 TaxID=1884377 RepID=UPI0011601467
MGQPTAESLEQTYAEADYELVCFGHHHIVHHFVSTARTYFNPGSLGCYHLPKARYGIVTVNENGISARIIEVPYNNERFLHSYHKLEVPEREFILRIFHGGQL